MPPKCKSTIQKNTSQTSTTQGQKQIPLKKGSRASSHKTSKELKKRPVKRKEKQVTENKDTGQPVQACSTNICSLGVPNTSIDTVIPDISSEDTVCANTSHDGEYHVSNISWANRSAETYNT